jgi:cytochrome P450
MRDHRAAYSPSLTPERMRRFAFVRYVFERAAGESRLPEPSCAAAILGFQDAAELLLQLAAEHHGLRPAERIAFKDYWIVFEKADRPLTREF